MMDPMKQMEQLEVGLDDPQMQNFQGSVAATPEEDAAMSGALADVGEFMYSEKGMAAIMRGLNQERPLWEVVPEISKMILEKSHNDMKSKNKGKIDSSLFFGEGGLLQQVPSMLFEIAEQMGRPGATDPEEIQAAIIGTYKKAGEWVLEQGDEASIAEAHALGAETLLTQPDGSMASPKQFMKQSQDAGMKSLKGKADQHTGLLGV